MLKLSVYRLSKKLLSCTDRETNDTDGQKESRRDLRDPVSQKEVLSGTRTGTLDLIL